MTTLSNNRVGLVLARHEQVGHERPEDLPRELTSMVDRDDATHLTTSSSGVPVTHLGLRQIE